ncbi:terminase large subunit [Vibrio coralliilyticus]|nr:terminase large subunit [Vibrio coralliilyticus]NUW69144.1 terminase large subunit [Vibrio coralliilyticus]
MDWSTACPDWATRVRQQQSLVPPPLFPEEAAAALRVFETLILVDVAGSPTLGEASRPWLRDFVSAIFGAQDPETGRRLMSEFFLLVSKKNAKSSSAAGIMLTALILNWRHSAEFLILAPTIEIAKNSFIPARDMVNADERLSRLLRVQEHIRTITHRNTGAILKIVAADKDTVSGKKATGILVDELWLFGHKANAENLFREAQGGLASRPEGFVIYLTTQSDTPPAGVFKQRLDYARNVRDGAVVDPSFLPVLYEFPDDMLDQGAHLDPENFYITNPNLGLSVDKVYLERELLKAQNHGKASLMGFLAKHLNVEMGMALRNDRWAGAEFWAPCAGTVSLTTLLRESEVITVGIDGGGLDDLYGLAAIGRRAETQDWLVWAHAWAHPIVLERRKDIAPSLLDFAAEGSVTLVENLGDDLTDIVERITLIDESGLLADIGCDQHGLGSTVEAIVGAGIAEDKLIGVPQGWKLQSAIKAVERRLAEGTLTHSGQAMMAWCVSNARVKPVGNGMMITKAQSGSAKIDPLIALFNAAACMARNPEAMGAPAIHILAV